MGMMYAIQSRKRAPEPGHIFQKIWRKNVWFITFGLIMNGGGMLLVREAVVCVH